MKRQDEVVPCGCGGNCGLTFVRTYTQRGRKFAPDCPVNEERLSEMRRASARRSVAKRLKRSHCTCGCGLQLSDEMLGLRFHPDCPTQKAKAEKRPGRKVSGCRRCEGMAHRRDQPACRKCGEPYKPLPPLSAVSFMSNQYTEGWRR